MPTHTAIKAPSWYFRPTAFCHDPWRSKIRAPRYWDQNGWRVSRSRERSDHFLDSEVSNTWSYELHSRWETLERRVHQSETRLNHCWVNVLGKRTVSIILNISAIESLLPGVIRKLDVKCRRSSFPVELVTLKYSSLLDHSYSRGGQGSGSLWNRARLDFPNWPIPPLSGSDI